MSVRRVNVYLDAEVHDRVKAAVERIPGLSVSEVVRDCLSEMVPVLEALGQVAASGADDASRAGMERALGHTLLRMALGEVDQE